MQRTPFPAFCLAFALATVACGGPEASDETVVSRQQSLGGSWRPFSPDSPWNLRLSPGRYEAALSSRVMGTGHMGFSDDDFGIEFFAATASDPLWTIHYDGYNNGARFDSGGTLSLRAPSGLRAPGGSDGTVILVEEGGRYAYEMFRFSRQAAGRGSASYIVRVDLLTSGVHEGVTGGGVPGVGGLLRTAELESGAPIRHKLWVAANPEIVYERHQWPALREDATGDGSYATLVYGDVVALSKDYRFDDNPCGLSPFMQRLAHVLQDYGGIVVDKGADSLGFPTQVNGIRDNIDIDYRVTMWQQLGCLKRYMVKVINPWDL